MTRDPEKAKGLRAANVEVVRGDFRDPGSLRKAVEGVDAAFVVGTPYEEGPQAEVKQGKAMIDACAKADVGHIVYSSVCCANDKTGIPHFESKHVIEEHLKESGCSYTILRPVWFMENFASEWYRPSIEKGVLSTPLRPDKMLQMVSVADVGRVVADALSNPARYRGREFDLAGDEMTIARVVKEISRVTFRIVRYEQIPESAAEKAVGHDMALMFEWLNDHGFDADVLGTRNRFDYYGVPLVSFRHYLGWNWPGLEDAA